MSTMNKLGKKLLLVKLAPYSKEKTANDSFSEENPIEVAIMKRQIYQYLLEFNIIHKKGNLVNYFSFLLLS